MSLKMCRIIPLLSAVVFFGCGKTEPPKPNAATAENRLATVNTNVEAPQKAAEILPEAQGLDSANANERLAAVKKLGASGDFSTAGKTLLAALEREREPDVRAVMVETMGRAWRGEPAVLKAVTQCLSDEEKDSVRAAASETVRALGETGKAGVPELRQLLRDERFRLAAFQTLGEIGPFAEAAVEDAAGFLTSKRVVERRAGMKLLRQIGLASKKVLGDERGGITGALHDEDAQVREEAALCVKRIGGEAQTEAVRKALEKLREDSAEGVRRAATSAYEKLYAQE